MSGKKAIVFLTEGAEEMEFTIAGIITKTPYAI
jgi:hypothetical protein